MAESVVLLILLLPQVFLAKATTIRHLHIVSEIQSMFAVTDLIYRLKNEGDSVDQVDLCIWLPENAFISALQMYQDGATIQGTVERRSQADFEFDEAQRRRWSAARVRRNCGNGDDELQRSASRPYLISISMRPHRSASVNITYQEVLRRSHGFYKHVLYIDTEKVQNMQIDVLIAASGKFRDIFVPGIAGDLDELPNNLLSIRPREQSAHLETRIVSGISLAAISANPTQKSGAQMAVLFDVIRQNASTIQTLDGYFLHQFLTPTGIRRGTTHVIFVLDKSGSMAGEKISQMKSAMSEILAEIPADDSVNIILFDKYNQLWKKESVRLDGDHRAEAVKPFKFNNIQFVESTSADGGTNMAIPLLRALHLLDSSKHFASIVFFLTDGRATIGKKESYEILDDIRTNNRKNHLIFSLSFGEDADFTLLRRLSEQNGGLARKIYPHSDAAVQITGFYGEIVNPVMRNLTVEYLSSNVDLSSLVRSDDSMLFGSDEHIEIGKILSQENEVENEVVALVTGQSSDGYVSFQGSGTEHLHCYIGNLSDDMTLLKLAKIRINFCRHQNAAITAGGFIEMMWAHFSINELEKRRRKNRDSDEERQKIDEEIEKIALKFGLVTRLTSMLVVTESDVEWLYPFRIAPRQILPPDPRQLATMAGFHLPVEMLHHVSGNVISLLVLILVCSLGTYFVVARRVLPN